MRKKILIAEKSDAIRSIAESLLHQNGYDVVSASGVVKAKELIVTSRPNMVIIGADLKDDQGQYLYDSIEENEQTASIPLLLIADPDGRQLSYPEEVILPRPFDPKDFMDKVRLFVGGGLENDADRVTTASPFTDNAVDEEFLDSALGIDRIEVENSEVMDKTTQVKIPKAAIKKDSNSDYGIHQPEIEGKDTGDSDRVESLMIRDDSQPVKQKKDESLNEDNSSSARLEIASDQYGLLNPDAEPEIEPIIKPNKPPENHDYDWFLKEMQKDVAPPDPIDKSVSDQDQKIESRPTSDAIEPINPPGFKKTDDSEKSEAFINPGGVEQFISKFKEEIEHIASESSSGRKNQPHQGKAATVVNHQVSPDRTAESPSINLDPDDVRHFMTHLVQILSEKLAKQIVDKLDQDEIYAMIKDDLVQLLMENKSEIK
nr:hypothetical protein [candidate division Zixibacteria bacterium]